MDLVGVSRVIPSGKMYRQIFDDEINLVRALGETRKKMSQKRLPLLTGRIPLVRDLEACSGNGFLSHRQQAWVEGMPNDDCTENPIKYKEAATLAFLKTEESENVIAAREVRGLAEVIIPEKKNSNIIDRIVQRRKCHHEEMVLTLRQELARIGKEMEPHFLEPGRAFLSKLSDSDKTIESIFQILDDDTNLEPYTIQDFEQLWHRVVQETLKRRQWIKELDEALCKAELDRTEQIKALLRKYTKILEDIAYHLSSDVHRFIHKEAMMINQALLANRRAIARLFVNLMEADLKRDVFHHCKLEKRIKIWKVFQKAKIIAGFREFMDCDRIQDPSAVRTELENMLKDQLIFAEKRSELLYSLSTLLPLKHSKAEINEWYASVVSLNKRIDTQNVQYMMRIRLQYEKICQECLSKVQECKRKLMDMKVCTENEADKTVNPSFFQIVGKLQSQFEHFVEKMDYDLEQLAKHTEINCKHLYQYFQDALVLFDTHQNRLTHQENDLHNKLNECRNKHENLNKLRGIHLDMAVDKLRIQSSDEKMKAQLEKVFAALDFIRTGYMAFHHDMLSKLKVYPNHILHELISYSASVSRYFYVKQVFKGKPLHEAATIIEEQGTDENAEDGEKAQEAAADTSEERKDEKHLQVNSKEKAAAAASEQEEKPAEKESPAAGSNKSGVPGNRASFVLGSDEIEKSDEESSPVQESEGVHEADDARPPAVTKLSPALLASVEDTRESFTTSSGNTYKVIPSLKRLKAKKSERFYTGKLEKDFLPAYVQQVYLSESFFMNIRRQIRLQFYEHLEQWFARTFSNACVIVAAKKEELSSELQLRLHLHEPRRGQIEKDVYHVRIAELRFHNERLARHCTGLVEALNKEKYAFFKLRDDQNAVSKTFRRRIQEMEHTFLVENSAEKLMTLSTNLHTELINHVEVMQLSLRSYRQYLEEALGKLRDANTDFLKACKLFADGGNFSSEEIEVFTKRLQKESGRIDFVEGLIMIDLEKMESTYLEQATEIINKFESRFHYLALDRVFMEKIQRFLTNIQVKIKTEVAKSNLQTQTLNSHLDKLISRIDACAYPNVDKESVTSESLYEFAKYVVDELKKRSKYLNCLLGLDVVYSSIRDPVLQCSIVTAFQSESLLQESKRIVMGVESTPLMNPCKMGKPAFDDAAFSVIKHLIGYQRYKRMADAQQEKENSPSSVDERGAPFQSLVSGRTAQVDTSPGTPSSNLPATAKKSSSIGKRVSLSTSSIQKYAKITRAEKKTQIFGDRPKENDCDHFKGIIFNILWDNFDTMMNAAEDFYKKDKHPITRPDFLQDTYDQCIDVLGQKLLTYLHQANEYHVACISEFRDQLKRFEEQLPYVTQLVVRRLFRDHEQLLMDSIETIRCNLQDQLQKWDMGKDKNKNTLSPSLGHPDNIPQLDALCQEEEERQKEQTEGINFYTKELETCVIECTQRFISTLASSTEKMLVELDDCLTVDDVQHGKIEVPREKTSTLLRRKKAGLSLETEEYKLIAERGSRSWPGLPQTTLEGSPNRIICQETASVTTVKTTLGHMAAVEERDTVYVKFKQLLEVEFAQIQEQKATHLMKAQLWANWWKKSVQKIRQLYATPSLSHFSFSPL